MSRLTPASSPSPDALLTCSVCSHGERGEFAQKDDAGNIYCRDCASIHTPRHLAELLTALDDYHTDMRDLSALFQGGSLENVVPDALSSANCEFRKAQDADLKTVIAALHGFAMRAESVLRTLFVTDFIYPHDEGGKALTELRQTAELVLRLCEEGETDAVTKS